MFFRRLCACHTVGKAPSVSILRPQAGPPEAPQHLSPEPGRLLSFLLEVDKGLKDVNTIYKDSQFWKATKQLGKKKNCFPLN